MPIEKKVTLVGPGGQPIVLTIQQSVGSGGYGQVFSVVGPLPDTLSHIVDPSKAFCLKMGNLPFGKKMRDLERIFDTENRIGVQIGSYTPNVPRYYGCFKVTQFGEQSCDETDETVAILMEYLPGRTLFDTVSSQSVSPDEIVDLLINVAVLLAFLQSKCGFEHRDLKPSNILVGEDNKTISLVDLGLSRTNQYRQTEMPPFFCRGHEFNKYTDLAYLMTTLARPFTKAITIVPRLKQLWNKLGWDLRQLHQTRAVDFKPSHVQCFPVREHDDWTLVNLPWSCPLHFVFAEKNMEGIVIPSMLPERFLEAMKQNNLTRSVTICTQLKRKPTNETQEDKRVRPKTNYQLDTGCTRCAPDAIPQ